MAIFGKHGFIRQKEVSFAKKLLVWKYEKAGSPLPDDATLSAYAQQVVDDAHEIVKKRGGNLADIVKDGVNNIRKGR